ncbi:MAG: hypothetical protein ACI4GY_09980 [Acutalibacteraceae bacterium]
MKMSKKVCSIVLSLVLVLVMAIPAFCYDQASAYAEYDRAKVQANDKETIDSLNLDQIAGIVLDWVDRKIAEKTSDFNSFNVEIFEGVEIPVELNITSLDGILGYSGYLQQLGGDFENLDVSALDGLSRANGDINFIYGVIQFVADNADTFGKVFSWEEGQTFDFGKVGEYILTLPEDDEIRVFYNDYLIGNNIQEKFKNEIAREMNYTVKDGETVDDVINNGILEWITGVFSDAGLLSDEAVAEVLSGYDLKTTDIYTLVKNFICLLQSDNQVKIDTYYTFFMDNIVRIILKSAFGYTATVGETVDDAALVSEFASVYADIPALYELAGENVYYQSSDGSYYLFTINETDVVAVNNVTWGESFLNFDPPTVEIGDSQTVVGTYTPTTTDESAYAPEIYTAYSSYLAGTEAEEYIAGDAVPEEFANIIASTEGTDMQDEFKMTVKQGETTIQSLEVTFAELEAYANQVIAEQVVPSAQEAADSAVASIPFGTNSITINSITVALSYKGYATDDEFICEVTAVPSYDITYTGLASTLQSTIESIIDQQIDSILTNPVATIVVDNLSGSADELSAVTDLLNFVNTDFDVNYDVLDFAKYYDEYNGAVGQVNRILCDFLKTILSEEGYESLALTQGGNENFTANMQKLCENVDGLLTLAKQFMDENEFAAFAETVDFGSAFASEHGFNASMLYNTDFSDVENLYVCGIRMGCDMLVKDESGILYDLHLIVEDLDTLDAMAIGVTDYILGNVVDKLNAQTEGVFADFSYSYTKDDVSALNDEAENAKDIIMTKVVDLVCFTADYAADKAVSMANEKLADAFEKLDMEAPVITFSLGAQIGGSWEEKLTALTNRLVELTKGIVIASNSVSDDAETLDKLSILVNAIIPLGSMLSNASDNAAYAVDFAKIVDIIFVDCLDGNFDSLLRLFEVKDDAIAGNCSVNKALINASEYCVDAILPGTVVADSYTDCETVQETFTSSANDAVIAANCMRSLNSVKQDLVPAALGLIREFGLLPYFAECEHTNTQEVPAVSATCTEAGTAAGVQCADCGKIISGCEPIEALGHDYGDGVVTTVATCLQTGVRTYTCSRCSSSYTKEIEKLDHNWDSGVVTKAATCTEDGVITYTCSVGGETRTEVIKATGHTYDSGVVTKEATCTEKGIKTYTCTVCGDTVTEEIAMTGHVDSDGDNSCDNCGATISSSFFAKIAAFFRKIINWFKSLF